MKRGKLVSKDQAQWSAGPGDQHTKPCGDCPWRRDSLPGWLGGDTVDEWLKIAHSDTHVGCHTTIGAQCAGIAIYRRNACKQVHPPLLTLPKDTETVFNWPHEFQTHHNRVAAGKTP